MLPPDARKLLQKVISKRIQVTQGDRTVIMDRLEMSLEQLMTKAAKGDRAALRDLMEYAMKLGLDLTGQMQRAVTDALAPPHQQIIDAYYSRRQSAVIDTERVIAPDDLTRDDSDQDD